MGPGACTAEEVEMDLVVVSYHLWVARCGYALGDVMFSLTASAGH